MSKRRLEVIADDYDRVELKPGQGQTVTFSVQGTAYELDLSDKNVKKFTAELEPWVSKAQRPTGVNATGARRGRRTNPRPAATPVASSHNHDVRGWAQEQGLAVSSRGRISASAIEAYDTAH